MMHPCSVHISFIFELDAGGLGFEFYVLVMVGGMLFGVSGIFIMIISIISLLLLCRSRVPVRSVRDRPGPIPERASGRLQ